jgi:hypothetical protein
MKMIGNGLGHILDVAFAAEVESLVEDEFGSMLQRLDNHRSDAVHLQQGLGNLPRC